MAPMFNADGTVNLVVGRRHLAAVFVAVILLSLSQGLHLH